MLGYEGFGFNLGGEIGQGIVAEAEGIVVETGGNVEAEGIGR